MRSPELLDCPRLSRQARLRLDPLTGEPIVLWPERGLVLNITAARVLELCDGIRTVERVCSELAREYGAADDVAAAAVAADVMELLTELYLRRVVVLGSGS